MLKIKDMNNILDMGFKEKDGDYHYDGLDSNGIKRVMFRVYRGSPYIRYSKTGYATDVQLKAIHDWTKQDYIEWEND